MSSSATPSQPRAPTDAAASIAALFDEHCDFVCRVLHHYGVHESALDDAVQDVFVTAYRRYASFEGRSSPRSWLFGIARRIAYRYRRSADTRARRITTHSAYASPPEGVDEPFARVQAAQSLATLLGRIDRDKRAVFVLSELEGMTAPEVADALGIPVGTAYSRLRAAWLGLGREAERERERLRRELRTMQPSGPSDSRRDRMWGLVAGSLGPAVGPAPSSPARLVDVPQVGVDGDRHGHGAMGSPRHHRPPSRGPAGPTGRSRIRRTPAPIEVPPRGPRGLSPGRNARQRARRCTGAPLSTEESSDPNDPPPRYPHH